MLHYDVHDYASGPSLDPVLRAIQSGLAQPWEIEFTVVSGAGSQNRRVNCGVDEVLVVTRYTVSVEGAGVLAADVRSTLYEATDPEVGGTSPGRRSATEEPTKEVLVVGLNGVAGDFRSANWPWPGLPLRRGRHLGILQGGPTGPDVRVTAHGWRVPPYRRT